MIVSVQEIFNEISESMEESGEEIIGTEEQIEETDDIDNTETGENEETNDQIIVLESPLSEEILQELINANANLEVIIEYKEKDSLSLWEKPLKDYNALEGIGVVTLCVIVCVVIFKLIGGILTCNL